MKIRPHLAVKPALLISAIYLFVAGAWMFLSDWLLLWLQMDGADITRIHMLKGGAFVLVTAILLYRLIDHYRSSSLPTELTAPRSHKLFPLLVFAVLGLAIGASGWYTFSTLRNYIQRDAHREVDIVGQLKARQIEDWLQQNKADLLFNATNSHTARILEQWMRSGKGAEQLPYVRGRLQGYMDIYGFKSMEVYDLQGRPRLGSSDVGSIEHSAEAQRAMDSRQPVLVDFHQQGGAGPISFGIMVPMLVDGRVGGAMYASVDPSEFFSSLPQSWQGAGDTTEMLLVRREGERVLFLNKLRQPGISALTAGIPVADKSLAVAQAFAGTRGVLSGQKYNDRPVVNYIAEIRGSPWLLIARMEEQEAYTAINRLGMISSLTVALVLVMSGLGVWLWWQRQRAYYVAKQEREELRRQALEMNYDALSRFANDIILITDENGRIVQVNDRTVETYGYAREELINHHVSKLRVGDVRGIIGRDLERIRQGKSYRYEMQHQRKDGSTFPVEVSAQWIEQGKGNFIYFVLRDISKRKQAELALADENNKNRMLLRTASDGIHIMDRDGNVLQVSDAFCRMLGYSQEELLAMNVTQFEAQLTADQVMENFHQMAKSPGEVQIFETRHRCRNGNIIDVEVTASAVEIAGQQLMYASSRDITKRHQAERREHSRNHVLELVARSAPLNDILEYLVRTLEQENPLTLCSVLLVDPVGKHLTIAAAPSLPDFYNAAIQGMEIGMGAGSCGTAAFTGERVVVEDIQAHPYWKGYKAIAARAGLGACWAEPIKNSAGKVLGTFAVYHHQPYTPTEEDIKLIEQDAHLAAIAIERSLANEELHLASAVYQNSSEAMTVTDVAGNIITVNPAFCKVTGYRQEEVVGQNTRILNSGRHDPSFFMDMWQQLRISGHWQGEIWNRRKNGEIYPELLTISTIFDSDGAPYRYVAMFVDLTQRKEIEQLLWRQANYDLLTGLPNRNMFHDRLEQETRKSDRSELPLALLFLDLDRFKEVNDTLGHDMGDILLKEAARRLSTCVRDTDTVARLGGDEFTVILADLEDLGSVERIVRNMLKTLTEPFKLGDETVYSSASIGITYYPNDASGIDQLLKNADQAMYAVKQRGRNGYHYFTPSMQEAAQAKMRLTNDLRTALANEEFIVHYQPIIDFGTLAVYKAETLVRWQHPTRGLISPADFVPIAEETGLIVEIGNWVLHEAAKQVKNWRVSHHAEFQISVNKSPVQFHTEGGSQEGWLDLLEKLELQKHSIIIEITEGLLLEASTAVNDKLLAFRDAGMQVALDDFGTGYSSLSYLKKFHIDYLKIDQSFVRNLENDTDNQALCEAIVMMAHKLGMKVIAEGVETAEQCDLLTAIGCDYGQGFLFSPPLSAQAFDRWLTGWKNSSVRPEKVDWEI